MSNGTIPNGNGRVWWAFTTLFTILISICGAVVAQFQGQVRELSALTHFQRERIAVLENQTTEVKSQLHTINLKLDRLAEHGGCRCKTPRSEP
jgi:hypothetical protein